MPRSRYRLEFDKLELDDERYEKGICTGWWQVRDLDTDDVVDSFQAPAGRKEAIELLRRLRREER